LSINWAPWTGSGMSAVLTEQLHDRWGLNPIDPSLGVDLLADALGLPGAGIVLADFDVEQLAKSCEDGARAKIPAVLTSLVASRHRSTGNAAPARPQESLVDRVRGHDPQERTRILVDAVGGVVADVLSLEPSELSATQRVDELGLDSLL